MREEAYHIYTEPLNYIGGKIFCDKRGGCLVVNLQENKWVRFLLIFIICLLVVFHNDIQKLPTPIAILIGVFACIIFIIESVNELQPMKKHADSVASKKLYHIICGLDIVLVLLFLMWIFIPLKNSHSLIILVIVFALGIIYSMAVDKLKTEK